MATAVRVGDTVNLMRTDGNIVTAQVVTVTDQDDIDLEYYFHDESALVTAVANSVRATSFPAAADEFWKMA